MKVFSFLLLLLSIRYLQTQCQQAGCVGGEPRRWGNQVIVRVYRTTILNKTILQFCLSSCTHIYMPLACVRHRNNDPLLPTDCQRKRTRRLPAGMGGAINQLADVRVQFLVVVSAKKVEDKKEILFGRLHITIGKQSSPSPTERGT